MLKDKEIELMKKLLSGDFLLKRDPPSKGFQSMVDRGYIRISEARVGPLGVKTGEKICRVTEAGKMALKSMETLTRQEP